MLKIFECHSYNIHGQGLGKFPSMLRVEAKAIVVHPCKLDTWGRV